MEPTTPMRPVPPSPAVRRRDSSLQCLGQQPPTMFLRIFSTTTPTIMASGRTPRQIGVEITATSLGHYNPITTCPLHISLHVQRASSVWQARSNLVETVC